MYIYVIVFFVLYTIVSIVAPMLNFNSEFLAKAAIAGALAIPFGYLVVHFLGDKK